MDRQYFINGQWLTYEDAHNLFGMTLTRPQIVTFYTDNLNEFDIRKDSNGTLYDSSIKAWLSDINLFNPPLYFRVSTTNLYKGNREILLSHTYSSSYVVQTPDYVEYNSSIISISSLREIYGITDYICQDYVTKNGITIVWYDQKENMYWDDRLGHKEWVSTPPEISEDVDKNDMYIAASLSNMSFYNTFEESSLPTLYRVSSFKEQDDYFNTPKELLGFVSIPYENIYAYSKLYDDLRYYNISLYVSDENGITSPFTGNFYQYGYEFAGDLEEIYVESDEDVIFWKGSSTYTFGKTHDEYHTELNPLYWCVDTYKTLDELHEEGYSTTAAMDIEVLNSSNNTVSVWWKVISTGNIYCEGVWYNNESELNNAGYYIV